MSFINSIWVLTVFGVSILLCNVSSQQTQCKRVKGMPSCVCKTRSGKYIDLRPLGNQNQAKPKLIASYDGFDYSVNPCYGVALEVSTGACTSKDGMVGCQQKSKAADGAWGIGSLATETIYEFPNGTAIYVEYTKGQEQGKDYRSTKIYFNCNETFEGEEFTTEGDKGHVLEYVFYLKSSAVCPKKSIPGLSGNIVGPIGLAIISVAILGLITYFIVGIIVNMFVFKKTGLEIIPQKTFWFSLPFLVKDGVFLVFVTPVLYFRRKKYEKLPVSS